MTQEVAGQHHLLQSTKTWMDYIDGKQVVTAICCALNPFERLLNATPSITN